MTKIENVGSYLSFYLTKLRLQGFIFFYFILSSPSVSKPQVHECFEVPRCLSLLKTVKTQVNKIGKFFFFANPSFTGIYI